MRHMERNMYIKDEKCANETLNKIHEIIYDDNLSDTEALEKIISILNNLTTESIIDEQKKN